jgi:predicted ABC-type ATPase
VQPRAVLIAGANGAGKTSFARDFLPRAHPEVTFLNADEIGSESRTFEHPVAAGRELLRRLGDKERLRGSFILETTLSSTMYARRIRAWKATGYFVLLHFIEVPSEEFAIQRVAKRVAEGGHGVPEPDIRRRYHRGLALVEQVYKPLVDEWYHWYVDEGGFHLGQHEEQ